ncbi:myc-type bHLH transcription factor [Fusarium subglutinans]|uniref:Myc-type bHLH transcription factor n=1 Tax=Gibberella subglutinans TaxID=42677 RepID=A0A8H5P649_GIBSU|nr:myc-type bHLH transcription factor [Fusarium subglutinans]KAF5590663.1 myc-type bHLH transcription factor [Fusarium subglutinans]
MADISFDYFDHPQNKQHLVPTSFYDPADFSGDSAHSPDSPLSPVFNNPYQLPVSNDWVNWDDKATLSPDLDALPKQEPFEGINLSTIPSRNSMELSPAINPHDLSGTIPDAVPFGRVGLNDIDTQPLFQTPIPSISSQPPHLQSNIMHSASNPSQMSSSLDSINSKDANGRYPSRKRKSSGSGSSSSRSSTSPPPATRRHCSPPKKTAHNMIEKRYRTNLNDKIAALRDSVPALRVMVHRLEQPCAENMEEDADEDLGGLAPAHKLNKATILSKATEYIAHLEKKNKSLARENSQLRNRVEGFEMIVMSRDQGPPAGVWA